MSFSAHKNRNIILSRLDSAILEITPVVIQPDAVVHVTLFVLSRGLKSLANDLEICRDESHKGWQNDWATLEPSWLIQVSSTL